MPPPPNSEYVEIAQGSTIRIEFNENASTGYRWECSVSSHGLTVTSKYEVPQNAGFGGGGKRVFEIVAEKDGLYDIEFRHKKAHEKDPIEEATFKLAVKPWI